MPNESRPDNELTPQAIVVLDDIIEETEKLRALDLSGVKPATVFEAG
jgi:hypothetical protein